MSHRDDVQGLRAVAVLLVALGHAGVKYLKGGYVGVDVFFVLSGFLITGLLVSSASGSRLASLMDFYVRRARRILPAAALTLVVTDVVAYGLLNFVRAKQVLQDSIPASLFVANFHFASQGTNYFAQGQPPSPIQHFWSLGVEEQFYLVWPLVLLTVLFGVALRRRRSVRTGPSALTVTGAGLRRLFAVIAIISAASLAWSVYYTHTNPAAAYFSTFARAWELGLGAALAIAAPTVSRLRGRWRALLGWIGIVAIGVAAVRYSSSTEFPGYAALLPTVGAALVIAAGLGREHSRLAVRRVLSIRPLRYIGDRSYAFYLWHWPFLIIAMQREGHALSLRTNLLLLAGAFLLSIVSYRLFENPIRRSHWSSQKQALVLWPASILAVLVVAGWGIGKIDVKATRLADAAAPQYPGFAGSFSQRGNSAASSAQQTSATLTPQAAGGTLPAVVAAANAAQHRAPIPSGLTPPVGSLLSDHFDLPAGCEAPSGKSTSEVCRFGDLSASRTLVVMGDFHAQMWMPAIIPMAQTDGWLVELITKSSCTPADWYLPQFRRSDCSGWYQWAQQQIGGIRPEVTIIAGDFSDLGQQDGLAISGVGQLITKLSRFSKHVIVMGDTYVLTKQPVDCLLSGGANMGTCTDEPDPALLQPDSDLASSVPGFGGSYIDISGWFCYQNRCPMVIGHTPAYVDEGHISATYSAQLADAFRTAFRKAIAARG